MDMHEFPPARPSAEWISSYAKGLLSSTPGLQPLDAVRRAMDASAAAIAERPKPSAKPVAHSRGGPR